MNAPLVADNPFLHEYSARAETLLGRGLPWLDPRRARAVGNLRQRGIPHRRIEEWKYTDLRAALELPSARSMPATHGRIGGFFPDTTAARLRMMNGTPTLETGAEDLPSGVEAFNLVRLAEAPAWVREHLGNLAVESAMGSASLALMQGGVAIHVTGHADRPLYLEFEPGDFSGPTHWRALVVIEPGASLTLAECYPGGASTLTNLGLEIVLKENARLDHVYLAERAPDAVRIDEIGVAIARDAHYRAHLASKGARLARVELGIRLEGEGSLAELSGASVLGGNLHADITTHLDHVAGRTTSRQLFKNVAGGSARAVYQGKITVRKGADESDSRQTAKALLLGPRAEADLKPELEILADDVKCAHGAAVGDLDADSLFYLRSRGLPEGEARLLLIRGFLEEAVAEIVREDLRAAVWDFIASGLVQALESAP